jgi:hypothetical protein
VTIHDSERAAETISMDLGDHDARKVAQRFGYRDGEIRAVPVQQRPIRHLAQEGEIEAGGIDLAWASGDDHLQFLVGADDLEGFDESLAHRPIPAIAFVRSIERDRPTPASLKRSRTSSGHFLIIVQLVSVVDVSAIGRSLSYRCPSLMEWSKDRVNRASGQLRLRSALAEGRSSSARVIEGRNMILLRRGNFSVSSAHRQIATGLEIRSRLLAARICPSCLLELACLLELGDLDWT